MLTTSPDLKCRLRMVAVLVTAHRHGTNPYAFATEELARQARARYVGQWGHDELPGRMLPHDPETAIQEYFGATQGRESADIEALLVAEDDEPFPSGWMIARRLGIVP